MTTRREVCERIEDVGIITGARTLTRRPWRMALVVAFSIALGPVMAQGPERTAKVPGMDVPVKSGWRVFFHDGCRFAAPLSWHADADGSVARAADGSNISIRMFHITDWAAHKGRIKAAFGRVNAIHEDSDRRLWLEIGDRPHVQHYIDVVSGVNVCSALLEVRSASEPDAVDIAKTIGETVGFAPEKWPSSQHDSIEDPPLARRSGPGKRLTE